MKLTCFISLLILGLMAPLSAQQGDAELIDGEIAVPSDTNTAATDDDANEGDSIDDLSLDDESDDDLLEDGELEETTLDAKIESLKKEVLSLNRDLFILEEDLLFPSNTQFSIFLSMDAGALFGLDSIQLKIDDKNVSNHLYTERELAALKRGGVQRLYIGNLASGEHEIIAIFTGVGPKGRDYRRGETIVIEKSQEPQFVEFTIADDTGKEQPQFDVRVWE